MNSRKKTTGSEANITSTMIWGKIVIPTAGPHFRVGGVWFFCLFLTLTIVYLKKITLSAIKNEMTIQVRELRYGCSRLDYT
jgi:hypothetical protein